jgi:uncharacterized protein with beta-barrel porin domain
MREISTTARLLAATAICFTVSAPANAGDYGLQSTDATSISNPAGTTIQGDRTGVYSTGSALNLDNAGAIRGDGNQAFFGNSAGGVVLQGGPGFITNSGSISGQQFGITTIYVSTDPFLGLAIGSTVNNSGSIIGDNNDGIRLIGGGMVTNSGYIAGRVGAGADGISMFSFEGQDLSSFDVIGSVTNTPTGVIEGNRFGVILSNGGIVDNAGTISGNSGSILIQAQGVGPEPPRTAAVTNSGTLNGTVQFNNNLTASVDNSGTISNGSGPAIYATAPSGPLSVTNQAAGSITGGTRGILSEASSFSLVNDGAIRGNGNSTVFSSPDAGVLITGGPSNITNNGTISGQQFGISTFDLLVDPATFQYEGRAVGTTVTNTGTIIGDHNDGVRLIGGGIVTNSGYIAGRLGAGADGVSMFAYEDQDTTGLPQIGTVNNLAGGTIEGNRFGIIQSGGGTINNAGTINGGTNGAILIQTGFIGGKTGAVTNSGTIHGTTTFYDLASAAVTNTGTMSDHVQFDTVTSESLTNSGSITTASGDAIISNGALNLHNNAGGIITGGASGIFDHGPGLSVTNAGTIRGNGDIGIAADGGPASITNSGTIYGRNEAILTFGSAGGSTVNNSGAIRSDFGPAVQLLSGSVTNSGAIAGSGWGVLINSAVGYTPTVTNLAGGSISAVGFANGGTLTNSGVIGGSTPSTNVAINFWSSTSGRQASLTTNAGSFINGRIVIQDQASASVTINGRVYLGTGGFVEGDPNVPKSITSNSPIILEIGSTGWIFEPVQLSDFADILILRQGSAGSPVDARGGSDTAQLTGTINSRSALRLIPTLTNFETLQVTGGYWRQYSNQTFGSTTITTGTLELGDASLTSPITIFQGGTLAGNTGRVFGNVTLNSGGIISPGGSYNGTLLPRSTLTVTGNLIFNSGSAYSVNTSPDGSSDHLVVNGAVTINSGATLQVLAGVATYPSTTTSYTIVTATGGITGKFDKAVTDYAYYNASVNYQKKGAITLNITPNGKPLPSAATATTFGAATAVESLGTSSPIYQAVLNQSLTGARQAFDSLSGSAYARLDALMASDVGHVALGFGNEGSAPALQWTGTNSLAARGLQSGSSVRRGPVSLMTIGGRYVSRLATDSISANVDSRFLASAAGYRSGRFQALASLTSAWHDVAVARTISFPSYADHTTSRYTAQSHRVDVEGSYALVRTGTFSVAPYGGYSRVMMRTHAFEESGGIASLTFGRDSRAIDQLRLGARARGEVTLGSVTLAPRADVSLNRSWGDLEAGRQARFVTGRDGFDSVGSGFERQTVAVDAGLDVTAGPVKLTGSYNGRLGNRWRDHRALVRAAIAF